ncbi:MAG: THUMP-like domain-containing protein [Chloroflexota bacterium]
MAANAAGDELESFHFLLSEAGQRYLRRLAQNPITDENHLAIASRLRQELGQQETHAVLETALLRQRAVAKFSRAEDMYFTRSALEQASAEPVARYRAQRMARAKYQTVADLGCGIGGDALALAQHCFVMGIDVDQRRLAMARENVRAYGHADRFQPLLADLTRLPALRVDAFFADPARRDARGKRIFAPDDYMPPLAPLLDRWLPRVPHGAVKVSPGIDYAYVPANAGLEFVSLDGDVKEGVLWFGDLHDGSQQRATLLPGEHTLSDLDDSGDEVPVGKPARFLYEPDGAVIRAHLVEILAQKLGAHKIDDDIAYLTAEEPMLTPFARCFAVEATMPFQLKKLRARLRDMGVGRVTVKKRGSPLSPQELQRRLDLSGEREVILFLTHVQGEPTVLIGREYTG